ncbi:MAG: hypothetical protein HGB10_01635 [Coriobacteriia bacterium]|nr:hypothetical protein [Coriobacteriia bacterium]
MGEIEDGVGEGADGIESVPVPGEPMSADLIVLGEAETQTEPAVEPEPEIAAIQQELEAEPAAEPEPAAGPDSDVTSSAADEPLVEDADTQPDVAEGSQADETEPSDAAEVTEVTEAAETAEGADAAADDDIDDIAAAVAAADAQVGAESTLDDIAPGSVHTDDDAEFDDGTRRYGAPWWPYLVYLGLWAILSGVAIWQFEQLPADAVMYETLQYTIFVFAGLALGVIGIFLIVGVWLASRASERRHRAGLLSSAMLKGAIVVFAGVFIWWGTLFVLDYLRFGRLL